MEILYIEVLAASYQAFWKITDMTKAIYLTITCCLFIVATGCKKTSDSDNCVSYEIADIGATGPNIGSVNQNINFNLAFTASNGCGHFDNIEEYTVGDTTTIRLKLRYEGCVCNQSFLFLNTNYTFQRAQPGVYILKFMNRDESFSLQTVIIQ